MLLDLITNPLVVLFALAIIITVLMFIFVGRKKKNKQKKVEKVYDSNAKPDDKKTDNDESVDMIDDNQATTNSEADEYKDEKNIDGFDYVGDSGENLKEKKVSKVYVRKSQEKKEEKNSEDDSKYQKLSERAEFVKTSKHVSKLSNFRDESEALEKEELTQEFKEEIKDCDTCNELKSRFDRSRRLSKSIKDDNFDEMFASHITEHYMNIDTERHVSSSIEEDIFKRANQLVQNGETRALDSKSQVEYNNLKSDKDKLRYWLEHTNAREEKQETTVQEDMENLKEEFNVSLRNLVLTESILKRKRRK